MNYNEMVALCDRLDREGPVDVFISEEEYEGVKLRVGKFWGSPEDWMSKDYKLILAFFRGYTFYRDLSENNDAFWQSFCEELGLPNATPKKSQYDAIWKALGLDDRTKDLRIREGQREFVKSIDAIWGIRSFKSGEVVEAFKLYYKSYPGEDVTAEIMQDLLPFDDETSKRQLSNYHRVFQAMARVVDYVLEHDLAVNDLDALELQLHQNDVSLGEPNVLGYFANKSQHALSDIFAGLRLQRTPEQFKRHLKQKPPLLRFRTPQSDILSAQELTGLANYSRIPYGEYYDLDNNQAHHVVPSARISLAVLKRLARNEFQEVAGLDLYISDKPFDIETTGLDHAETIYFGKDKAYIWADQAKPGAPLFINAQPHPKALGSSVVLNTNFRYHQEPLLTLEVSFRCFSLVEEDQSLHIGNKEFRGISNTILEVEIDASSVPVRLNDQLLATWNANGQIFTKHGLNITNRDIHTQDVDFWLLGAKPLIAGDATVYKAAEEPEVWQVVWTSPTPLQINQTSLYRSKDDYDLSLVSGTRKRSRNDIEIFYDRACLIEGEMLTLEVPTGLGPEAKLIIGEHVFVVENDTVKIDSLPRGTYQPELKMPTYSLLLSDITVMPRVMWEPPSEPRLIEGKTYAAKLTLEDGRFKKFRFKPRLDVLGEPILSHHVIEVDDGIEITFDLRCKAYAARLTNREDKTPLSKLEVGQIRYTDIAIIDPYQKERRSRIRLASEPERTYSVTELNWLVTAADDQLFIEVCLNESSKTWALLYQAPISSTPTVKEISLIGDKVLCLIEDCRDTVLRLEESDLRGQKVISNSYDLPHSERLELTLQHPYKFDPVHTRIYFSFASTEKELLVKEFIATPYSSHEKQLMRGIAWGPSRKSNIGAG